MNRNMSAHLAHLALPALLLLAVSLHLPSLPLWTGPVLLLAAASRFLPPAPWVVAARLAMLFLLALVLGLNHGWLAATTLRVLLLAVLVLKWAEQRPQQHSQRPPRAERGNERKSKESKRKNGSGETGLIAAAALVALATGGLHLSSLTGLAAMLSGVVLWCAALLEESGGGMPSDTAARRHPWLGPASRIGGMLRSISGLMLRALPLAVVLFLFFPRIPGPLWDIGLTLGLPLSVVADSKPQGLGIGKSFSLGAGQTLRGAPNPQQDAPVFVAEFSGWVPETTRLYWRGPVFYDFDGKEWTLAKADTQRTRLIAEGWNQGREIEALLRGASQRVEYSVRLTPHGENGLYALDMPARLTTESYVSPELQLRSMTPIRHETTYSLASWLNVDTVASPLSDEKRARALALPPGNPRLKALGEAFAREHPDPEARARALFVELAKNRAQEGKEQGKQNGFRFSERFRFDAGPDALDRFWFDDKAGNAALYAGSFAALARAAGLPARVVTGFRGGKLMALTHYVVVKSQHAHAWTELWIDGKGWMRFDPSSAVAPEKFTGDAARKVKTATAARLAKPLPVPAQTNDPAQDAGAGKPASVHPEEETEAPAETGWSGWNFPDIENLLERWVIHFDAGKQMEEIGRLSGHFSGSGENAGGIGWITLLGWLAGAAAAVWLCGALLARWREARALPPAERIWRRYQKRLEPFGLAAAPGECPSKHALRLTALIPKDADRLRRIAGHYLDWRYGRGGATAARSLQREIRELARSL